MTSEKVLVGSDGHAMLVVTWVVLERFMGILELGK